VVSLQNCSLNHASLVKLAMPSYYDRLGCHGAGHPRADRLPGGFPSLTKGLCAAYHVTDCLQVLSVVNGTPKHFHVFDPCGSHLFAPDAPQTSSSSGSGSSGGSSSSSSGNGSSGAGGGTSASRGGGSASGAEQSKAPPPMARRYALDSSNSSNKSSSTSGSTNSSLMARFPDQFAPFAPYLASNSSSGSVKSGGTNTLLRLPLRSLGSSLSPCALDAACVASALLQLEQTLRASLVTASSLGGLHIDHWPLDNGTSSTSENYTGSNSNSSNSNSGCSNSNSASASPRPVFSAVLRPSPLARFFPRSSDSKGSSNAASSSSSGGDGSGHAFRDFNDSRTRRQCLIEDREAWARRGLLSVFTKFVPPKDVYAVEVAVVRRERIGVATADRGKDK